MVSQWTFHSWFKRMITGHAHGARDCPGYPGQSAQSDAMLEGSMMSVHPLYTYLLFCVWFQNVMSMY